MRIHCITCNAPYILINIINFTVFQKSKNPPTDFLWIQKLSGSVRSLDISDDQAQCAAAEPVSKVEDMLIKYYRLYKKM